MIQAGEAAPSAAIQALLSEMQDRPGDHRRRLRVAAELLRSGAHAQAIAVLAEGLALTPLLPDLLVQHCVALRVAGRHALAEDAIAALAAAHADHPRLHQLRGDLAGARGDPVGAMAHYRADCAAAPADPTRSARLAQALNRAGRHDEAIAILSAALAQTPASPELLLQNCVALRLTKRFDEADRSTESLAEVQPGHPLLDQLRGDLALARDDLPAAIRHFTAHAAAAPLDANRHARLAQALLRAGSHAQALAVLAAGLATAPRAPELLAQRCVALRLGGQFDDAEAAIAAFATVLPDHPRLHPLRGELASARGDHAGAIAHYLADFAAAPADPARSTRLAQAMNRAGRHDEAITILAEALVRTPGSPELLLQHCVALRLASRFDEAARGTERLAEVQPGHPLLDQLRGDLALARDDFPAAIRHFTVHAAAAPLDANRHARLAQALLRAGSVAEALAVLAKGLAIAPGAPELLAQHCVALRVSGQFDEAGSAIAALAAAWPNHERLHQFRGDLAILCGDGVTAIEHFQADFLVHPQDPGRRIRLANGLRRLGDLEAALTLLDSLPNPTPAELQPCGEILLEMGRFEDVDRLLRSWPVEPLHVRHRWLAMRLAMWRYQHTKALALTDESMAQAPDDSRTAAVRAEAAALLFQSARAWEAMRQVNIPAPGGGAPRRGKNRLRNTIGQIINEQRLRPEETAALAAAANTSDEALLATGAGLIRDGSDSIGPALAVLTALSRSARRPGEAPPRLAQSRAGRIPHILHQYWDAEDPPADVVQIMDRSRASNPGFTYHRWNDAMARRFLEGLGRPDVLRAYRVAKHAAMRSDVLRLALLHVHGGVYLDADDLCIGRLDLLLPPSADLVVYNEIHGSIGNNFLAAAPGGRLIGEALAMACAAVLGGASESIWLATGPGLMSRVVARAVAEEPGTALPDGVIIVPLPEFLRVIRPHIRLNYKTGQSHWIKAG